MLARWLLYVGPKKGPVVMEGYESVRRERPRADSSDEPRDSPDYDAAAHSGFPGYRPPRAAPLCRARKGKHMLNAIVYM